MDLEEKKSKHWQPIEGKVRKGRKIFLLQVESTKKKKTFFSISPKRNEVRVKNYEVFENMPKWRKKLGKKEKAKNGIK